MRPPRSILLGLAAVFASPVIAQNNDDDDDNNNNNNNNDSSSTSVNTDDNTSTATDNDASTSSTRAPPSTTTNDAEPTSSLPDIDETSTTSSPSSATSTTTTTASSTTQSVPAITSDTGDTPPLPTLPGSYSYPPPAVPPTKNAPFMQKSNLPQGTVFIAVGAILGAFAVAILIWRAVVACLLHRSVKRATLAQQVANDKNSYPPPSAPFYKYSDHASSISLGNSPGARPTRKLRGPVPSGTPSQSNLFFSPTAPAGASNATNRESRFLPSGFYASGAASPQGHEHSISLTNLRPDSHGHARALEPSPPESPNLAPPHNVGRRNLSSSTLNLNRPASGRTPSAFLEDLLGDQPEQFPPGHRNTWNQPSNRF
ncbi:hypothetical protein F5B22DRAFT_629884 [Xylaria bambusicola]|uniref:uncharacterized protein n=1 Tax=Xylaria bambusicola TaxID=326684 RepID=UPI002008E28F|nr:uncharacterized protein F5B22DRAFT_629884 [Xylaria bambusicola]KAI0503299.1 hypothetical protein F5B22DRAFT_629884 [Xylaria bambusicola]